MLALLPGKEKEEKKKKKKKGKKEKKLWKPEPECGK